MHTSTVTVFIIHIVCTYMLCFLGYHQQYPKRLIELEVVSGRVAR